MENLKQLKKKILIIGGDSRLAKELKNKLIKKKINFIATSRRKRKNYLDFKNINDFKIPENISCCIILGGITDYNECENNKKKTRMINAINIPKLAIKIISKKVFLCYVSSNTVLNYNYPANENKKTNPKFEYSLQKSDVENKLINYANSKKLNQHLSILRLTKNICQNTQPFKKWIKQIKNKKNIEAFDDLYFSPILFSSSANILFKIIKHKKIGIFHLSNKHNLNYFVFAKKLIKYLRLKNKIIKKSSKDYGINLLYKHDVSSLSMRYTRQKLKVNYVKLNEIFKFFKNKINAKKN